MRDCVDAVGEAMAFGMESVAHGAVFEDGSVVEMFPREVLAVDVFWNNPVIDRR